MKNQGNKKSVSKVDNRETSNTSLKLTLTVKSWTELLWDWPAIERTDRKLNNSGLENPVLVGGDEKEAGETCVKRERVGFELDEIGFAKSKDADMGPKTRLSFLMRKRMVEQSIGPSIYVDTQFR